MDQAKFNQIAEDGITKLTALTSPFVGMRGGELIAYNAYFHDTEVVVLGYQYEEDGHTFTKPVAILVDGEVFDHLHVDGEAGRLGARGQEQQPLVKDGGGH